MKARMLVCVLVVFLFGLSTQYGITGDFDWPRWRGPNGDGISMETYWDPEALNGGPKILWKVDVGVGYSNVAIKDNRLYTIGRKEGNNHILCLNAETGQEIWRYSFETKFVDPASTPFVDSNRVYGLSAEGTLLCLKAKNGKVVWEKELKGDFNAWNTTMGWVTSPVVEGDMLLLNANTVAIALDKKNGEYVWGIEDEVPSGSWGSYATAVVSDYDGARVALFIGPSTLNAVEVATGEIQWSYTHGDTMHPVHDPILFKNKVFISFLYSCAMLEITESGPKKLWGETELNNSMPTAVLVDGYLYGMHQPRDFYFVVGDWDGMMRKDMPFRCIDAKTGTVMWQKNMKTASVTAADGKLIMLELNGTLRIAEATSLSYKEHSSADVLNGEERPRTFATPPVLCNGKIYCRNRAGDLICIDVIK